MTIKAPKTTQPTSRQESDPENPTLLKATGHITYDVKVNCPHCNATLRLNQYPYNEEGSGFCSPDSALENEIFGSPEKPSKWVEFDIKYQCRVCAKDFSLNKFEI